MHHILLYWHRKIIIFWYGKSLHVHSHSSILKRRKVMSILNSWKVSESWSNIGARDRISFAT